MKFGKEFGIHLEETLPEWRDKYLSYKPLKKLLKSIPPGSLPPEDWFLGILNEELEKFNDFYVDKEEEFIIRFQALKERIEQVTTTHHHHHQPEAEFNQQMLKMRKDFVSIHGEMILLKNYSSLNFAGLIKILKKYDKRTGELLSVPFARLAVHQPFFTTEPLTRLVRECEAKLDFLFPTEPEVVEPAAAAAAAASCSEAPPGEDIYRSIRAAVRAIQGLKSRASSTYNPLSLSYIFWNKDDDEEESAGAVTAQNS
ncbi:hypothetical protein M569_15543, partial [Genlisea aurea]